MNTKKCNQNIKKIKFKQNLLLIILFLVVLVLGIIKKITIIKMNSEFNFKNIFSSSNLEILLKNNIIEDQKLKYLYEIFDVIIFNLILIFAIRILFSLISNYNKFFFKNPNVHNLTLKFSNLKNEGNINSLIDFFDSKINKDIVIDKYIVYKIKKINYIENDSEINSNTESNNIRISTYNENMSEKKFKGIVYLTFNKLENLMNIKFIFENKLWNQIDKKNEKSDLDYFFLNDIKCEYPEKLENLNFKILNKGEKKFRNKNYLYYTLIYLISILNISLIVYLNVYNKKIDEKEFISFFQIIINPSKINKFYFFILQILSITVSTVLIKLINKKIEFIDKSKNYKYLSIIYFLNFNSSFILEILFNKNDITFCIQQNLFITIFLLIIKLVFEIIQKFFTKIKIYKIDTAFSFAINSRFMIFFSLFFNYLSIVDMLIIYGLFIFVILLENYLIKISDLKLDFELLIKQYLFSFSFLFLAKFIKFVNYLIYNYREFFNNQKNMNFDNYSGIGCFLLFVFLFLNGLCLNKSIINFILNRNIVEKFDKTWDKEDLKNYFKENNYNNN